jgi:hypothetical protein
VCIRICVLYKLLLKFAAQIAYAHLPTPQICARGVGFGYNKITISKTSNSNFTGVSYGPLFRAGIRFGNKKNSSWGDKAIDVNFYFKQGLEKEKYVSFGSAVLINL